MKFPSATVNSLTESKDDSKAPALVPKDVVLALMSHIQLEPVKREVLTHDSVPVHHEEVPFRRMLQMW
jgi:hypothetical protein